MRKRIQDRAKELGVTQTSNSVSSIGETQTSAAEAGRSSELDMSAFSKKEEDYVPKYMQAFSSGKEGRELTDEEVRNSYEHDICAFNSSTPVASVKATALCLI